MVSTMDRLVILGRFFFALAFIGLGVQHFLLGEFIIGRAPAWPESIPGRPAWAYLTGIAFIVKSVVLISGKGARAAAIVAALPIFMWALVRRIPIVAADSFLAPTWTQVRKAIIHIPRTLISVTDGIAVFEALAASGIAFVIAGFLYEHGSETSAGTGQRAETDRKQIVRILY
jgi:uncharacterized membrane protein YphA (DoxX/SURF4 family)